MERGLKPWTKLRRMKQLKVIPNVEFTDCFESVKNAEIGVSSQEKEGRSLKKD